MADVWFFMLDTILLRDESYWMVALFSFRILVAAFKFFPISKLVPP